MAKRWRDANPELMRRIQRRNDLKRMYGITPEEYDALLEKQGGGCGVCGATENPPHGYLSVDHCHSTGAVRGLLCNKHNLGIGHFGDDPDELRQAIAYLEAA